MKTRYEIVAYMGRKYVTGHYWVDKPGGAEEFQPYLRWERCSPKKHGEAK